MPKEGKRVVETFEKNRKEVFRRFPILFIFLTTFGFVAVFHGFENMVDQIPFFANNPATLLFTGIVVLLFTGTLYKKLQ